MTRGYQRLVLGTALLAMVVIVMGAYVRLSDAGLSCPDWPGCYGHLLVPSSAPEVALANTAFPDRPVLINRAWKEMIHRYLAAALGCLVALLAVIAWCRRSQPSQPVVLPIMLFILVTFQAALGMWTVTLLLKPIIVTAHLLGGMATLALLWWLWMRSTGIGHPAIAGLSFWAVASVVVVVLQLALGGWTSANYAAMACIDFPTCRGMWWPDMEFTESFYPWRELGQTSAGEPLTVAGLTAIQFTHRIGAVLTLLIVGVFAGISMRRGDSGIQCVAALLIALLVIQASIGVATVLMARPLSFAVAHNAVAVLMLLTVLTLGRKTNTVL